MSEPPAKRVRALQACDQCRSVKQNRDFDHSIRYHWQHELIYASEPKRSNVRESSQYVLDVVALIEIVLMTE